MNEDSIKRQLNDRRRFNVAQKGAFDFLGGVQDGRTEEIPLSWLRTTISGETYCLAVIENPESNPPIKYCLVHKSLLPKESR